MKAWVENVAIKKYEDRSGLTGLKQGPLVWTEVFLREINRQSDTGILHFWPMAQTVILGKLDSQVAQLDKGLASIGQAGYSPIIRSLGGLAVVADEGILNVSLILPNPSGHKVDLRESYQVMVDLITQALSDFPVEVVSGEVATSYCPGTYDLSIKGRKFAGLAQRIYQGAIAISAYISVSGNQVKRGQVVANFYAASFAPQEVSDRFPQVNSASMANLSDLVGQELTVEEMKTRIEQVLVENGASLSTFYPSSDNMADFMALGKTIKQSMEKYGI
ncbi:TPA: lipoate--protein ligase family protein [Streptococcus suis]